MDFLLIDFKLFCTKIWNAARFMQMQSEATPANLSWDGIDPTTLTSDDKHLLLSLDATIAQANEHLERYRFNDYSHTIYSFVWNQFCDWYVEVAKEPLHSKDPARVDQVLLIMHRVFRDSMKLLHPLMPFITEELWEKMGYNTDGPFIMQADWPVGFSADEKARLGLDERVLSFVEAKRDMIRAARQLRADYNIKPSQVITYIVKPTDASIAEGLSADAASTGKLVRGEVQYDAHYSPEGAVPGLLSSVGYVYMPVDGLIDVAAEIERLSAQLEDTRKHIANGEKKLSNTSFIERAPEQVVKQQRDQQERLLEKAGKLESLLESLQA